MLNSFFLLVLNRLCAASVGDVVCNGKRVTAREWIGALEHKPCAELLLSALQFGNPAPPLWLHALYVSDMSLLKGLVKAPGKRARCLVAAEGCVCV